VVGVERSFGLFWARSNPEANCTSANSYALKKCTGWISVWRDRVQVVGRPGNQNNSRMVGKPAVIVKAGPSFRFARNLDFGPILWPNRRSKHDIYHPRVLPQRLGHNLNAYLRQEVI
jgi:hypothetical protein